MAEITIFTDGACSGNPGRGGYGVLIRENGSQRTLSEGFRKTTNNRMELMAVIAGLKAVKPGKTVQVFSDSKYIVDALNKGWVERWKKNGWQRNRKEAAQNVDLWEELLKVSAGRKVTFSWVKGHDGHRENERVDRLAVDASRETGLSVDRAYETGNTTRKPRTLWD